MKTAAIAVRSSSEIAGTASILIAAELMITNEFGKGLLVT
jgi:alanine dehydrogenase